MVFRCERLDCTITVLVRAFCPAQAYQHVMLLQLALDSTNVRHCFMQNTAGTATRVAGTATAVSKQIPPKKPAATAPVEKPVIISVDPPKTITMIDWDSLISKELAALSAAKGKLPEEFQSSTKHFAR